MSVSNQDRVDFPQAVFWEPFYCSCLEVFPDVDHNCSISKESEVHILSATLKQRNDERNYTLCPFLSSIRSTAEVLRRIFFFPSGVSVERQVRHILPPGGDVMHAMSGTLEEVPVPRKINSIPSTADFDCSVTVMIVRNHGRGDNQTSSFNDCKRQVWVKANLQAVAFLGRYTTSISTVDSRLYIYRTRISKEQNHLLLSSAHFVKTEESNQPKV